MKEIVIISGKGGTGKTSLSASFAALAERAGVVDCDVDAPNLAIVLKPRIEESTPFTGGKIAVPDRDACTACGCCVESCRFGAIALRAAADEPDRESAVVDPLACEGCAVCTAVCPEGAIHLEPVVNGEWFVSRTRYGPFVHARLGLGQDNSGKLVARVRKEARALAERESLDLLISDGPPGIGCPVIASLGGADLVLIVAEPTVAAIHDFERVADLARHFEIPALVCINKADLNPSLADRLEHRAEALGVATVGRIPYHQDFVHAQIRQTTVVEYAPRGVGTVVRGVWERITRRLELETTVPSRPSPTMP
jgi:MinD superfamily P-loop ATPase